MVEHNERKSLHHHLALCLEDQQNIIACFIAAMFADMLYEPPVEVNLTAGPHSKGLELSRRCRANKISTAAFGHGQLGRPLKFGLGDKAALWHACAKSN